MQNSATSENLMKANKSPLNTSKAKAMFKFNEEKRFPGLRSSGRYSVVDSVMYSMITPLCSTSVPHPSATATKLTYHCNFAFT